MGLCALNASILIRLLCFVGKVRENGFIVAFALHRMAFRNLSLSLCSDSHSFVFSEMEIQWRDCEEGELGHLLFKKLNKKNEKTSNIFLAEDFYNIF